MRQDWLDVFLIQRLMDGLDKNKKMNLIIVDLHA